ncbi:hypothetical protein LTR08_005378 [Meristemomyces frigidus]|nr:hypothetical protein LTR08_005378 [Meristemomyces frigidus]
MSVRKRNEYLEGGDSEEELDHGYDSEAGAESRLAATGHAHKKRKTDADSESEDQSFHSFSDGDGDGAEAGGVAVKTKDTSTGTAGRFALGADFEDDAPDALDDDEDNDDILAPLPTTSSTKPRPPKSVAAAEKAARKSGVVYISRVPPFMKPQTLRHFLAPHASKGLGRIFLTPEDHAQHVTRVKRGGNKKKSFTDGWVEFASKTEAQLAAQMLNGGIIGGKKGNFYYDDLWNMKYLRGFKWGNLTEQIAGEDAERGAKLRDGVRRTRRENRAFLEDVERGKMLEGMGRKEGARRGGEGGVEKVGRRGREFKQRKVQGRDGGGVEGKHAAGLKRVLGQIM